MKEHPILFSGPMVCVLLRDWEPKTQSRRLRGLEYVNAAPDAWTLVRASPLLGRFAATFQHACGKRCTAFCPYGQAQDRLWVRETWQINHISFDRGPIPKARPLEGGEPVDLIYRADGEFRDQFEVDEGGSCWRPSIFMPRWASRISLDLLSVRVERLQSISEADAKAEGVACGSYVRDTLDGEETVPTTYVAGFKAAWDAMHAKKGHGWEHNPWLWVLDFKRVHA